MDSSLGWAADNISFGYLSLSLSLFPNFSCPESTRKNTPPSPALNLIHGQSHHSLGHIWIGCLDIQFTKGLLSFTVEGTHTAPILYQNDRVPERIQGQK